MEKKKEVCWAVRVGRKTGVFFSWEDAFEQVTGFPHGMQNLRKFKSIQEAEQWLHEAEQPSASLDLPQVGKRQRKAQVVDPTDIQYESKTCNQLHASNKKIKSLDTASFHYFLSFDGGSRGNGQSTTTAGSGAVLYHKHQMIWRGGLFLGAATNNEAEYKGLILGLRKARELKITRLKVNGDSKLVINQVNKQWRCDKTHLQELCKEAMSLMEQFEAIDLCHVLREHNKEADQMANYAMNIKRDFDDMIDPDDDEDMIELHRGCKSIRRSP
mmetsp:Transcript_19625/g.65324  ORF Transcript_19625/g.65324 Transcript_19625/m.65324 type:complete len:271 (-) Transcript_19625:1723-2535(-)